MKNGSDAFFFGENGGKMARAVEEREKWCIFNAVKK